MSVDLILRNGRFTTLDRLNPTANAAAISNGILTDADVQSAAAYFAALPAEPGFVS